MREVRGHEQWRATETVRLKTKWLKATQQLYCDSAQPINTAYKGKNECQLLQRK
jgi:hypothetical protein